MEKTLEKALIKKGYEKDIAHNLQHIAQKIIQNPEGKARMRSLHHISSFHKNLETTYELANEISELCDNLKSLENEGYIEFNKGYYEVTKKALIYFNQKP